MHQSTLPHYVSWIWRSLRSETRHEVSRSYFAELLPGQAAQATRLPLRSRSCILPPLYGGRPPLRPPLWPQMAVRLPSGES